jgi:hypothetical protein
VESILACGPDRHACERLDSLMRYRYDAYRADQNIFYEGDTQNWFQTEGGEPQPVYVTSRGGELRLAESVDDEWLRVQIRAASTSRAPPQRRLIVAIGARK